MEDVWREKEVLFGDGFKLIIVKNNCVLVLSLA